MIELNAAIATYGGEEKEPAGEGWEGEVCRAINSRNLKPAPRILHNATH